MRWIVRLFAVLMMLGGLGAGFVYPRLAENATREIGRWIVYEQSTGFAPVTAELPALNRPIRAFLDIRLSAPLVVSSGGALITVTGAIEGQTVLAAAVNVDQIQTKLVDPQSGQLDATVDLGEIANPKAGTYTFTAGPGDAEADRLMRAALVIVEGGMPVEPNVQPIGLVVLALGFVLLVVSFRRSRTNPNSQPPAPKWGRGGS
jgi:hypothetical protein